MSKQVLNILSEAMTKLVASRFRVLGEPMRLRILQALEDGEKPVNDIVVLLKSSQPNISKHLKTLCQERLVDRRRAGLNIRYSIADPVVFKLCDLICRTAARQTRSQLAELELAAHRRGKRSRRPAARG